MRRPSTALRPGRARKRFSQHFLEPVWVTKVLCAIAPEPDETFLEIGPGRGALTRPLAAASRAVVAFEIDRDLARDLRTDVPPNVAVVEGDFLDLTGSTVRAALAGAGIPPDTALRVAGNLPYNVASPILFKLAEMPEIRVKDATVMLQREVADRLLAPPGTRDYGVLSILLQHRANVARLLALPPGAFRPVPKVHSALVRLTFHAAHPMPADPRRFVALTQAIFTRRRKTLANALKALESQPEGATSAALQRSGIDGSRRPETLSIAELVQLSDALPADRGST